VFIFTLHSVIVSKQEVELAENEVKTKFEHHSKGHSSDDP
jgi:hypothetical protein